MKKVFVIFLFTMMSLTSLSVLAGWTCTSLNHQTGRSWSANGANYGIAHYKAMQKCYAYSYGPAQGHCYIPRTNWCHRI